MNHPRFLQASCKLQHMRSQMQRNSPIPSVHGHRHHLEHPLPKHQKALVEVHHHRLHRLEQQGQSQLHSQGLPALLHLHM